MKKRIIYVMIAAFGLFSGCSFFGYDTEKEVCEMNAQEDYARCLLSYVLVRDFYFGSVPQPDPAETYTMQYCSIEYFRKVKCPDRTNYFPAEKR